MYEEFTRPLNKRERRAIGGTVAWNRNAMKRSGFGRTELGCAVIIFTVLGVLLTIAHAPAVVILLSFAAYASIFAWTEISSRIEGSRWLRSLQQALDRDEAHVVHIQSDQMVEFEEIEDEGACYAFQVEPDKILFVVGQEFYSSAKFPNTDFSLVTIRDDRYRVVEFLIDKHGEKLRPTRTIPSDSKARLRWYEMDHLGVIDGKLEDLERLLAEPQAGPP